MPIPITKKKWRETRPTSCKASNVGASCDNYVKHCVPATDIGTDEERDQAHESARQLEMALRDALKKIKPKDKEKEATETLIADWLKQIKTYQGTLAGLIKKTVDDKKEKEEEEKREKEEAEKKAKKEYDDNLKIYAQKKNELLKFFQDESPKFDAIEDDATTCVAKADQLAKLAVQNPQKLTQVIGAIETLLSKVKAYKPAMDKRNEAGHKLFDPHRGTGAYSSGKLGILPKDSAPFSTTFTNADNLRKRMAEQAKSMASYEASIATSLEEAKVQGLPSDQKLAAYVKFATDHKGKIIPLAARVSAKGVGMKNILNEGITYKEQWGKFTEVVTGAPPTTTPEKKEELRTMTRERMRQKHDQVIETEEELKKTVVGAVEMHKRGAAGIPKVFADNPEVKKHIDEATEALRTAREFYDRWVQARTEAEAPYQDAVRTVDTA